MADGRVLAGGRFVGCGFAITANAVVTANHVVRDRDADDLRFAGRPVSRVARDEQHDVAVLFLASDVTDFLLPARPARGGQWRVDAQPFDNDPGLSGTVTDVSRSVVNAEGVRLDLLQLRVDDRFGDFDGYSGSAVLSGGRVIGVLVEQVPYHRNRPSETASNVLYAVPIDQVLSRFGLRSASPDLAGTGTVYAEWIENFLDEYLGRRVPFGGRTAQLAQLDAWLADTGGPPYALLTAEAGRGKSALLCRWAAQVAAAGLAHVVFVPISLRFRTAQAGVALPALAGRLAAQHGEAVSGAERSAEQWQAEITAYLRRRPLAGRPLLVIIDGLDEATDWEPGAHLFPAGPPPGVRVVVSARFVAGDTDESGWRTRLNWTSPDRAESIALPPLDRAGVSDVLQAMGNPLDSLVTRVDIVDELHRLSEGDPLLVHLYVDALNSGGDAASLTPEDLPSIEKGMRGYFDRWGRELARVQPAGRPRELWDFLHVLASALGPLTIDDVLEVNPDAPAGFELTWLLKEVERFVIGDGVRQGFVLSHPRFAMFFHEKMGRREQQRWISRFLEYGRRTIAGLTAGSLGPGDVSRYVLNYYGTHLENAHAPSADLYALLDGSWLAAWHAVDGTDAGFLNDCDHAWRRAEQEAGPAEVIFLCALARGSVAARSDNVPPRLLADAAREHVLTAPQALAICRRMSEESRRSAAVVALAPALEPSWLDECLGIASTIKDPRHRAFALANLAPLLNGASLRRALAAARSTSSPSWRAWAVAATGSRLPDPERTAAAGEALTAANAGRAERERGRALAYIAEFLPPDVVPAAVQAARELPGTEVRARALVALARYEPGIVREVEALSGSPRILVPLAELLPEVRSRALDAVRQAPEKREATAHLLRAQWWRTADRETVEELLVDATRAVSGADGLLPSWAGALGAAARTRARRAAAQLPNRVTGLHVAAHLLAVDGPGAPAGEVAALAEEARSLVAYDRALALTVLAACHTGRPRRDLLDEALASSQTIGDVEERIRLLGAQEIGIAQRRYVALYRESFPGTGAAKILREMPAAPADDAVDDLLELCRSEDEPENRLKALLTIMERLPGPRRREGEDEALALISSIDDPERRLAYLHTERRRFTTNLDRILLAAVEDLPDAAQQRCLVMILGDLRSDEGLSRAIAMFIERYEPGATTRDFLERLPRSVPEQSALDLTALFERRPSSPRDWVGLIRVLPPDRIEYAAGRVSARAKRAVRVQLSDAVAAVFGTLGADTKRRLLTLAAMSADARRLAELGRAVPVDQRQIIVEQALKSDAEGQLVVYRALAGIHPPELLQPLREALQAHPLTAFALHSLADALALRAGMTIEEAIDRVAEAITASPYQYFIHASLSEWGALHLIYNNGPRAWRPAVADRIIDSLRRSPAAPSGALLSIISVLGPKHRRRLEELALRFPIRRCRSRRCVTYSGGRTARPTPACGRGSSNCSAACPPRSAARGCSAYSTGSSPSPAHR
ncbi:serine protease [Actinoplanes sp. NPDC051861]|uniref:serine protease n=1 Tax=Actinoplanes sp. NPDC051861 TaxID=3155170 RepID=UPI00342C8C99